MKRTPYLVSIVVTILCTGQTDAQNKPQRKNEYLPILKPLDWGELESEQRRNTITKAQEDKETRKVATFQIRDEYLLTLYDKPKQMQFVFQRWTLRPIWPMYYLEATNSKTKQTRRVWSIYDPWNYSKTRQWRPHEFAFSIRDENRIGLAFLRGSQPAIGFHEIDLTQTVEPVEIPDQPLRPGASYVPPESYLNSLESRYNLNLFELLNPVLGEKETQALLDNSDIRIKKLAWSNGDWKLTLELQEKQFTFVRQEVEATWQLDDK